MEAFEFHFTPTRKDFADVMRASLLREWSKRLLGFPWVLLTVPALMVTALPLLAAVGAGDPGCMLGAAGFYAVAGAIAVLALRVGPAIVWHYRDPDGRLLVEMKYVIGEEAIRRITPDGEVHSPWADVEQMVESKEYFIFPTTTEVGGFRLAGETHFIPRRVFKSAEQADRFRKFVRRKLRQWSEEE